MLILARKVDLLLCGRSLGNGDSALHGVTAAASGTREDSAEHDGRTQNALALRRMYSPGYVPLRNVSNFVCKYARQFVFVSRRLQEARVDANEAAGQRERIDYRTVDDKEVELVIATGIGLRGKSMADFIYIFSDLRIFHELAAGPDLAHDGPTQLVLVIF